MKSSEKKCGGRTSVSIIPGCKVTKLLPYNKLVQEINNIDVGKMYEIDEEYLDGFETDRNINGSYRDLREYLPRLAQFYLRKNRKETLKWFGETDGTFCVARLMLSIT